MFGQDLTKHVIQYKRKHQFSVNQTREIASFGQDLTKFLFGNNILDDTLTSPFIRGRQNFCVNKYIVSFFFYLT